MTEITWLRDVAFQMHEPLLAFKHHTFTVLVNSTIVMTKEIIWLILKVSERAQELFGVKLSLVFDCEDYKFVIWIYKLWHPINSLWLAWINESASVGAKSTNHKFAWVHSNSNHCHPNTSCRVRHIEIVWMITNSMNWPATRVRHNSCLCWWLEHYWNSRRVSKSCRLHKEKIWDERLRKN